MKAIRVFFYVSFAVLTACGSGNWTTEDKDVFLDGCAAEGAGSSYCHCYLDQVMEHYPNPDDADKMDFETAVELADKCE